MTQGHAGLRIWPSEVAWLNEGCSSVSVGTLLPWACSAWLTAASWTARLRLPHIPVIAWEWSEHLYRFSPDQRVSVWPRLHHSSIPACVRWLFLFSVPVPAACQLTDWHWHWGFLSPLLFSSCSLTHAISHLFNTVTDIKQPIVDGHQVAVVEDDANTQVDVRMWRLAV